MAVVSCVCGVVTAAKAAACCAHTRRQAGRRLLRCAALNCSPLLSTQQCAGKQYELQRRAVRNWTPD